MALWLACAFAHAGKLDQVRDEVHGGDDDDDDDGSDSDDGDHDDDFDDDDDDWDYGTTGGSRAGVGIVLLRILAWPWTLPSLLVEGTTRNLGLFSGPPYANGAAGHMTIVRLEDPTQDFDDIAQLPGKKAGRHVTFGLSLDYAYDLDALHHAGLVASVDTSLRLGLMTRWTAVLEPLPGRVLDRLVFGSIDLCIRHVQHEHVEMHTGLGLSLMIDLDRVDKGIDFFYSVDVFPVRPLVVSAWVALGNLGNAFTVHGRAQLGFTFVGIEVHAGYQVWQIGRVIMQGPVAGIRIWL